jgi:hypothetical protein
MPFEAPHRLISADQRLTMAIDLEEIDAMSLMPLETPVLKVSRPVAVSSARD